MENIDDDNTRLVRKPMTLHNNYNDDEGEYEAPPIFISGSPDEDNGIVESTPILINYDETPKEKELEIVDADVCYKLISEDDTMNMFFRKQVNWEQEDIDYYVDGVIALVTKFQEKGFQFSNDQISRIKKITGLDIVNRNDLTDEELAKVEEFKKYFEIYTFDELYNKYLKTKDLDSLINGISKRDINKKMLKIIYQFGIYLSVLSEEFEDRYWRFRVVQDGYYKTYLDEDAKIDPELERRIVSNIPKNISDELMAYNLYIELNKQVSLDSRFYITQQDSSEDYNNELLNKRPDEVNPNNLVCRTWSNIYYYLIKKYTDIDCFISMKSRDGSGHRYVMLLMDNGNTIAVDGTNVVHDNMLDTNFTDILRCKLGLPTVNFTAYKDYHERKDTVDGKIDPKEIMEKIINIAGTKEEINNLNNLIKNNNLDTKSKLKLFMDFIEARKDIDSISMRALFSNLVYLFFKGQEKVYAIDYYKELDDGQYEYINCIKYEDDETHKTIYLLFDKELGFIDISYEELKKMISNGDIKDVPRLRF